jgi:ApaG protein
LKVVQGSFMSKPIQVHIVAQPEFLGQHEDKFAFSYTIYITNRSDQVITLRNRHWIITHANGSTEEVIGEGVVGKTPELAPGKSFSYTSGALIPTPVGSMRGSYGFITGDGHSFRVEIPEFALHSPDTPLH